jgi:hypothetical protein
MIAKSGYSWNCGKYVVEGTWESLDAVESALKAEQQLKELLARIHRDGGHHTDKVGLQRSCDDADNVLVKWREAFDAAESESARQKSARELLIERLEKAQTDGHSWLTIPGVLAMINSCDLQATKNRERQ